MNEKLAGNNCKGAIKTSIICIGCYVGKLNQFVPKKTLRLVKTSTNKFRIKFSKILLLKWDLCPEGPPFMINN